MPITPSYPELLQEAVSNSITNGLLSREDAPTFRSEAVPMGDFAHLLSQFLSQLHSIGMTSSRSLNGNCIQVHSELQNFMMLYGLEAHMTIGSMHGAGWDYMPNSLDTLLEEMHQPNPDGLVKFHTWLTLNDASVIDWTGHAWYDVMAKVDNRAENCLVYLPQGRQDDTHYYKPQLVGKEYLVRTRCITHLPIR